VSLTDPQARWTCAPGGPAFFAYSTNYLIDVEHGVIVDVEATPANRSEEVESTKRMIERVEATFAVKPERLIGDMAYGSAPTFEPTRVQGLPAEGAVLPQYSKPQDRAKHPRGSAGCRPPHQRGRSVSTIEEAAEESRDAVRALEAHLAARPVAVTRPHWCLRRVHSRSCRTEFTTPGEAHRLRTTE